MKPLRLEFEAFKSFPGRETIDFETLGRVGVFLVVGQTGTGKTSIFDAMTWALYGSLPGERRGRGEPRSQHAPPGVQTFVELEFESRGRRYLVRRESDIERPKRRGTGTTHQEGHAVLMELTNTGTQDIATGKAAVTHECKRLVGLELSQFEKVVLLPQGEFARFLVASEGEREELLRKLFDGDLYKTTMKILKDQLDAAVAELGGEERRVTELHAQAAGRLHPVIEERGLDLSADASTIRESYPSLRRSLEDVLAAELTIRDELAEQAESSAAQLAILEAAQRRFDAVEDLIRISQELASQRVEIEQLRLATEASSTARPVKEATEDVQRLEEEDDKLRQTAEKARLALATAKERVDGLRVELKRRTTEAVAPSRQLAEDLKAWDALVKAAADLRTARSAKRRADSAAKKVLAAFRDAQASHLAQALESGKPCPVCGSKTHPKPAKPGASDVAQGSELEESEAAVSSAADDLGRAEGEVMRLIGALKLPAEFDVEDASTGREAAVGKLEDALRIEAEISTLESELSETEKEVEDLGERNVSALGALKDVGGRLTTSRQLLSNAMSKGGFKDIDDALRSVLDEEAEAAGRVRVAEWDRSVSENASALKALREVEQVPTVRPETSELEEDVKRKRREAESSRDAVTRLTAALDESLKFMERAAEADGALVEARDKKILFERVWETCEGKNALSVSLERWVLAAELDRVVRQANVRLHSISGGRYALQRKKAEGKLGSLELEVLDASTGEPRGTDSFSGGERFYASLALALGLADVISQGGSASGLTFEALFIDEGFDALSEDFLDPVTDVLSKLHSDGRMVGAITHVSSMRERLPVGIEVRRVSPQGPSTLEVLPAER